MNRSIRGPLKEERGVEPTVLKILVGIVLVAIGLGVGVTVYRRFGESATSYLDYRVSVSPASDTISRANSGTYSVDVTTEVDFEKEVSLDATTPDNVECEFNPSSGVPTFGSTMEIYVGSEAEVGTHTITIKASSEDQDETDTLELTIEG